MIITSTYDSPFGRLLLGAMNGSICLCDWMTSRHHYATINRTKRMFHFGIMPGSHPILDEAAKQLDEYFLGGRKTFDLPLRPAGTDFQIAVWNVISTLPFGTTSTYSELAAAMGKPTAVRAIANACGANPISIIVPCHRVIAKHGLLGGYAGGKDTKLQLLAHEQHGMSNHRIN